MKGNGTKIEWNVTTHPPPSEYASVAVASSLWAAIKYILTRWLRVRFIEVCTRNSDILYSSFIQQSKGYTQTGPNILNFKYSKQFLSEKAWITPSPPLRPDQWKRTSSILHSPRTNTGQLFVARGLVNSWDTVCNTVSHSSQLCTCY